MLDYLRRLPLPIEFAIVVAAAFGYSIFNSISSAFYAHAAHSEFSLWRMVAVDAAVLLLLGSFLRVRGWSFSKLGLESHWMDGAYGAAMAAAAYCAMILTMMALSVFAPSLFEAAAGSDMLPKSISPWLAGAIVLVDPFYEELFVTGYIITALKDRVSPTIAINVSVLVRLVCYLHQGVVGIVVMIPLGLMFAYWYARTGRLWPVVVANAAINLIGLLRYVQF